MSDDEEGADKPFEPSQKKLDDARAKGEFAKSVDLTAAAGYGGFFLVCLSIGQVTLVALGDSMLVMLEQSTETAALVFDGSGTAIIGGIIWSAAAPVLPWFAVPAVLALLMVVAQRALVFTPSKIAPKLSRISPLAGIKNKFGRLGLFEFFKSMVKLIIYTVIMGAFLYAQIDVIIGSVHLPSALVMATLGDMVVLLVGIVCVVALLMGGIDYLWQAGEHLRKNRMSRKEMMDELKQSEGDPMMKQQRRMRGQEIAMNKMLADVPQADVVIVNPTHYAVALRWDRQAASAPVCVAKGVDEIAARIRELAHEHAVPVHSDPPTARALHAAVAIGQEIAPDHYQAVAAAIRFAEAIRQKARKR
ncbi:EscU/YscU/HrcU family type III secretion system export apparatus switch protein [Yoonia vestfoldensis]|uniref:EscU/YscU/HrcU family type III secretion system export apparatus switch protein n=1 Tax=Yoonia vestfoldensis TaxID=245188 RepID=UPI000382DF63|nr:flagellar type III secretion system protein FlhB [Yoonia vestfoldensis]